MIKWNKLLFGAALILSCGVHVAGAKKVRQETPVLQSAHEIQLTQRTTSTGKKKVSEKTRDRYFSDSAFVGNSVGLGLKYYFDSKGKGYLGGPVMLVQGCYSFANDKQSYSKYQIGYRGRKYKAKDAIAAAKVKRVFINMGTNDLWKPAAQTYEDYVDYIEGIRKENPKVVIFIESTTPMCNSRQQKYLNNSAINELNRRMKGYCEKHRDMYYIDISTPLKDSKGGLQGKYASDGYVHMTYAGYKVWTETVVKFVDKLILKEQEASDAVKQAAKSKTPEDYAKAKNLVKALKAGQKKDELKKKLSGIETTVSPQTSETY